MSNEPGMQTMKEGVDLQMDSVIINPSFTVQEMAPAVCDKRGKRGANVRVKVTDNYVEVRIRCTGQRVRVYFNP